MTALHAISPSHVLLHLRSLQKENSLGFSISVGRGYRHRCPYRKKLVGVKTTKTMGKYSIWYCKWFAEQWTSPSQNVFTT